MAKYRSCGNSGLFLKVNEMGMCKKCWSAFVQEGAGKIKREQEEIQSKLKYNFTPQEELILFEAFEATENSFLGMGPSKSGFMFALKTGNLTERDILDLIQHYEEMKSLLPPDMAKIFREPMDNALGKAIVVLKRKL